MYNSSRTNHKEIVLRESHQAAHTRLDVLITTNENMKQTLFAAALCGWLIFDHHCHAFYNPQNGKWVSRDPIEERGGENLANYLSNNSINHTDPFGLMAGCRSSV
jgi:hypothetical protein